jgi:hypothetical protein
MKGRKTLIVGLRYLLIALIFLSAYISASRSHDISENPEQINAHNITTRVIDAKNLSSDSKNTTLNRKVSPLTPVNLEASDLDPSGVKVQVLPLLALIPAAISLVAWGGTSIASHFYFKKKGEQHPWLSPIVNWVGGIATSLALISGLGGGQVVGALLVAFIQIVKEFIVNFPTIAAWIRWFFVDLIYPYILSTWEFIETRLFPHMGPFPVLFQALGLIITCIWIIHFLGFTQILEGEDHDKEGWLHRITLCSFFPGLPWCPKQKQKVEAEDPGTFYKIEHLLDPQVTVIKRPAIHKPDQEEGFFQRMGHLFGGNSDEKVAEKPDEIELPPLEEGETREVTKDGTILIKKRPKKSTVAKRLANLFTCGSAYSDEFEPQVREGVVTKNGKAKKGAE